MIPTNKIYLTALATVACLSSNFVVAQDVEFDHRGLTFENGDFDLQIGGRFHLDTVSVDDDITVFANRTDIRRLRIYASLELGKDWKAKIDGDVGGLSTGFKNVWLSYRGIENTTVKVGNFISPLHNENMMSSNNIKLIERSLGAALAPNFQVGGAVTYKRDNWSLTGGYFTNPINADPLRTSNDGKSLVARLVVAPIKERRRVIHLAAAVENRQLDTGEPSSVSTIPEFGLLGTRLVNTGALPGVEGFTNYNFEAGYMRGPFLIKGNYITRTNDAPALGDPSYSASSLEASWVVTGERQRYSVSSGTFGQVRPKRSYGAFEIAARYSMIDLNDGLVVGGVEDNWTVGGNWYINRNLRVMLNYVNAKTRPGANTLNEKANALIARFQIAY